MYQQVDSMHNTVETTTYSGENETVMRRLEEEANEKFKFSDCEVGI